MGDLLARATLATVTALTVAACTTTPRAPHPRPPRPIPADVAAAFAVPGPVIEQTLVPVGGTDDLAFFRGRLRAGTEETEFNLVRPVAADGSSPARLAILVPILGGGSELMWIMSGFLTARGWAVAWTERIASGMRPPQRGPDLESLFRRTVVHNRMVLDWADTQPDLDADPGFVVGVSLGGMVTSALLAVDPRIAGGAVIISGGDLPNLVPKSREGRVARWLAWRAVEDGAGHRDVARELELHMLSDPARLGAFVDARKVLMVSASFDTVIPPDNQDILWEAFGRPRRVHVPLSHYSAAIALVPIMERVHKFLTTRLNRSS